MPDFALADGDILTSTIYTTGVRQQVVSTCTSATRPTAVEGRVVYETDTDLLLVYSGSAWVPFSGPSTGSTSFTSTITQSAAITKTTNYSKWSYVGPKKIHWTFSYNLTSAGTAANAITLTVPLTAATSSMIGTAWYLDAGTQFYVLGVVGASTTTIKFVNNGGTGDFGVNAAVTVASGDTIHGSITYEIA